MKTPTIYIERFWRQRLATPKRPYWKRYYFHCLAENGEIVFSSQGYKSAQSRNKTVALIMDAKIELT